MALKSVLFFLQVSLEAAVKNVLEVIYPDYNRPGFAEDLLLLVLAFDEAHPTLESIFDDKTGVEWNKFILFRHAFQAICAMPIWSFFLSTTGKFDQFAAPPYLHKSGRFVLGLLTNVIPFTALGFDQLAEKFLEGMTLEDVTALKYRLSLGRPLYVIFLLLVSC